MTLRILAVAAVVGGLALAGPAVAGDEAVKLGRFQPGDPGLTGPTTGPTGADDTELVHWGRWGYRPYWGGFYGYRPAYFGGWPTYSYYSFYRPAVTFYAAPRVVYPAFAYPVYSYPTFGFGYSYYSAGFFPINGTNVSVNTPAVSLNLSLPSREPVVAVAPTSTPTPLAPPRPNAAAPGTFRYDGGPAKPVPPPVPDAAPPARPSAPAAEEATAIRIARPATTPTYRYTAYGER